MAKNFSGMSADRLHQQFGTENFSRMSTAEKQSLMQAYVDQQCKQDGLEPVRVDVQPLGGRTGGHYNSRTNTITINENMLNGGYLHNGKAEMLNDANYRSLEVLLHEYQHAWQNAVVNGKIEINDEELARALQANQYTTSPVLNGTAKGSQYISPKNGTVNSGHLYILNPSEKDAFQTSQDRMKAIMAKMPDDPNKQAYLNNLQNRGYEARLNKAQAMLGRHSNDVAKDMETVLKNAHFGEKQPVSKEFQNLVETEMALTYDNMHQNSKAVSTQPAPQTNRGLTGFDAAQQAGKTADPGSSKGASGLQNGLSSDLDAFDQSQSNAGSVSPTGSDDKGGELSQENSGPANDLGTSSGDNSNDNDNDNSMDISM